MKTKRWRLGAAAVAAVAVLGSASPAIAVDTYNSDTTGSHVYGSNDGLAYVEDTLCDGDPAYGLFIENGEPSQQRRNNSNGCGTTSVGDLNGAITAVKACRDTTLAPDNCGGWNEWID